MVSVTLSCTKKFSLFLEKNSIKDNRRQIYRNIKTLVIVNFSRHPRLGSSELTASGSVDRRTTWWMLRTPSCWPVVPSLQYSVRGCLHLELNTQNSISTQQSLLPSFSKISTLPPRPAILDHIAPCDSRIFQVGHKWKLVRLAQQI